jgi:hypothetical protein
MRPVRFTGSPSLMPTSSPINTTPIVLVEVQREAVRATGKFEHFAGHGAIESIDRQCRLRPGSPSRFP